MKIRQAPQFGAHIRINIKTYPENPSNDKQATQTALHVLELNPAGELLNKGFRFSIPPKHSAKEEFGPKNGVYARISPDNDLDIVCLDTHNDWLSENLEYINSALAFTVNGGIAANVKLIPSKPIQSEDDLNAVIASLKGTPTPTQDAPVSGKQSRLSKILKFLRLS
jgi:hypothetical protein